MSMSKAQYRKVITALCLWALTISEYTCDPGYVRMVLDRVLEVLL